MVGYQLDEVLSLQLSICYSDRSCCLLAVLHQTPDDGRSYCVRRGVHDAFLQDSFSKASSCSLCVSLAGWRRDLCGIRARKAVGRCTDNVWFCLYVGLISRPMVVLT